MNASEKLLNKLAKIQAHAESAEEIGNEAEAQAFAGMLQQLCLKHKIAMSDIQFQEEEKSEPIKERHMDFDKGKIKKKASRIQWQEHLAIVIAEAHFCRVLVHSGCNTITLVGRESDMAVAEYLFVTLARAIDKMANKAHGKLYREHFAKGTTAKMKGFKSSYKNAFINRLTERFEEQKEQAVQESSTALVRVEKIEEELVDHMKRYDKATGLSTHRQFNADGVIAGREAADSIDLKGNGINAGGPSQAQLGS